MTTTLEAVQRGTSFIDLPPELLTAICVSVACPTVVWCRLVCRRLRNVIDASLELQYRIELVRDGMIDVDARTRAYEGRSPGAGAGAGVSPRWQAQTSALSMPSACPGATAATAPAALTTSAERLVALRQLRKAWKTLSWTRCVTVPMPGPCCAYELVGGVFCKTQPTVRRGRGPGRQNQNQGQGQGQNQAQARVGGAAGGALEGWPGGLNAHAAAGQDEVADEESLHVRGSRTMSATWLPGTGDRGREQGCTVVRDDMGIPTRDFAMDPSQDLMVLFKGGEDPGFPMAAVFPGVLELHIRTMSTNQIHPDAGMPVLRAAVLYPVTSVFIQIADDVVGIMYCVNPARPRITIWNWKIGHLVADRATCDLPPDTWDFSFIHSRALFLTTGNGHGSLELFTFTCGPADTHADSDASSPRPRPGSILSLIHVATLHLPPVYPSVRVLSVGTHTGPFLAGCPPNAPFVSSNKDRIYVLTVHYVHLPTLDGPRMRPRVCVFVHHRALVRYLARGVAQRGVGGASAAMEVPWSEWGPTYARMLPHVGVFQWLRYVHGQRVVMLLPTSKAGMSTFQVLDFNVRRAFGDDDDKEEAGPHEERNEGEDADLSLSKTTLERVDYSTRIVMPSIFVDAVESGLPYLDVRRDVRGDYSGVMIDDERLVGLKANADDVEQYPAFLTGDMKEIDVFTM